MIIKVKEDAVSAGRSMLSSQSQISKITVCSCLCYDYLY